MSQRCQKATYAPQQNECLFDFGLQTTGRRTWSRPVYLTGNIAPAIRDWIEKISRVKRLTPGALAICEKSLGVAHPTSRLIAGNMIELFERLGLHQEPEELRLRFGILKTE